MDRVVGGLLTPPTVITTGCAGPDGVLFARRIFNWSSPLIYDGAYGELFRDGHRACGEIIGAGTR